MLNVEAPSQLTTVSGDSHFDAQMRIFRSVVMVALGIFAGTVLGGVCGLFVYANSRTPNQHDGVFVGIQTLGIIFGVAMGYLAARGAQAQEQLLEASQKAGTALLRRYKPKAGAGGNGNVGQRTIVSSDGEEFLRRLLAGNL